MEGSRMSKSNLTSPIKSETYPLLEEDKKLIIKKLHYLFIVYAAKSSRYAYQEISEKAFMELVEDVYENAGREMYRNSEAWKRIVTVYHGKGKKTGMVFQEFLKLLPAISVQFSRSHDVEDDLKYLMKHLLEVYKKKVGKDIEGRFVEFDPTLKKDTLEYISRLANHLLTVYKLYFPQEMTNRSLLQSFENVMTFFKEFQIYPKIISASQLYLIFLEIINNEFDNMFTWADQQQRRKAGEKGSIFTFSKFVDTLVRVAVVGISRLREVEDPEWWMTHQKETLKALFEYMQNVKVKNKNSRFKQVRFTFILLQEYSSESERWLASQTDRFQQPSKDQSFFQIFERMKL